MAKPWTTEEIDFLKEWYHKDGATLCAEVLERSFYAVRQKAYYLKVNRDYETLHKDKALALGYEVLEPYKATSVKILHRHISCGYTWAIRPNGVSRLLNCPNCSIKLGTQGNFLYYVRFPELDLYKIGITNNPEKRLRNFGYTPEVLLVEEFENPGEAYRAEQDLLGKLNPYKLNTGKLTSGNTETFIWPS